MGINNLKIINNSIPKEFYYYATINTATIRFMYWLSIKFNNE